jgi:hypothetical protein
MKSVLKKLIAVMLVLSMVFAFAACTDKKGDGNKNEGNDTPGANLNPGNPEEEDDEPIGGGNSETGDNDVDMGEAFN